MHAPCVRVPTEEGETTRQRLARDDLVAETLDIVVEDGDLYIPVTMDYAEAISQMALIFSTTVSTS